MRCTPSGGAALPLAYPAGQNATRGILDALPWLLCSVPRPAGQCTNGHVHALLFDGSHPVPGVRTRVEGEGFSTPSLRNRRAVVTQHPVMNG